MITGMLFRDAVISASNLINNHRKDVDALNVFPVPDGDTGTNMSMTISAAAREMELLADDCTVGLASEKAASALLRGARGNSGVILSLIFRGIAKGFKNTAEANPQKLAHALSLGVDEAYKAVMKPAEGTILTVIRCAAENATAVAANPDLDAIAVWDSAYIAAKEALAKTPEMLPVLKKAGVVDAGGQGLVFILEGMKSVLNGDGIIPGNEKTSSPKVDEKKDIVASASGDIKFGYCSEFLIDKKPGSEKDPLKLRAYLESIGDCVVVVDDDDIIKVHVHSNEPGNVIQHALEYGPLINIKIDNMRHQHGSASWGAQPDEDAKEVPAPVKPTKPYGFVAVAAGDGIAELFRELGVDTVVSGGQTMNPSTEDLLQAVHATPAKQVFILPNNKNIIMAAEQTIPLADRRVSVLQTRTIPQGITALLNFDDSLPTEENHTVMMKAAEKVSTGLVTFAARDSSTEDQKIKKGEILGIENGKINVVDNDILHAAYRVTKHLYNRREHSTITLIYGNGITEEQAESVKSGLENKFGDDVEILLVNGQQPVYYFIVSVE